MKFPFMDRGFIRSFCRLPAKTAAAVYLIRKGVASPDTLIYLFIKEIKTKGR